MPSISPDTTSPHPGNAYWMARLSKDVYLKKSEDDPLPDEEGILRALTRDDPGFVSVLGVDRNSAQAMLVEHQAYLCMVFRGTDELSDWLDNLDSFSKKELFGRFHGGFWDCVEDVWEPLFARYQALRKEQERPLFITGHSLGGAMATIVAARFLHEGLPFANVYTFGQPRAMRPGAAMKFNAGCKSRFFRFHNNNDIVTRVPAALMGYRHVGNHLYISEEKRIYREIGFWFRFLDFFDGIFSRLKKNQWLDPIEDHDMDEYLEAVTKWDVA
uniref:Lipase (Class 3) n=1 Tax=Candidatus Kentrum sp. DK TaxID=2126562 RepID=A0A450RV63_9GAMM|nr:MAG: Lipase (class 3) [Candidatus Kentron sp. DK]